MSSFIHPDSLYHRGQEEFYFNDIITFIYDAKTMRLFSEEGHSYPHYKLIANCFDYFYELYEQLPISKHTLSKTEIMHLNNNDRLRYLETMQKIRLFLQNHYSDRLIFGRSGFDEESQSYIYSFWEDYDDRLINKTVLELKSKYNLNSDRELVSWPSGTVPLGHDKKTLSKDEEDEARNKAKDKLLAHLMPAAQKKVELYKAGAKPKGMNPWRKEALELAKGYNEPWRLTSESKKKSVK